MAINGLWRWSTKTLIVLACCIALHAFGTGAAEIQLEKRAMMHLSKCGYLSTANSESEGNISEEEMSKAFVKFQSRMGIDVTGNLNAETFRLISMPGCGDTDIVGSNRGSRSKRTIPLGQDIQRGSSVQSSYGVQHSGVVNSVGGIQDTMSAHRSPQGSFDVFPVFEVFPTYPVFDGHGG